MAENIIEGRKTSNFKIEGKPVVIKESSGPPFSFRLKTDDPLFLEPPDKIQDDDQKYHGPYYVPENFELKCELWDGLPKKGEAYAKVTILGISKFEKEGMRPEKLSEIRVVREKPSETGFARGEGFRLRNIAKIYVATDKIEGYEDLLNSIENNEKNKSDRWWQIGKNLENSTLYRKGKDARFPEE